MEVVVISDSEGFGWHGERIRAAFAERGCDAHFVDLPECYFEVGGEGQNIRIPGFEARLPDGVFVRNVPRGSLQEVVFYLDALHALRHCGVPVCNDAVGIERTVDKAMTSFLLRRAGVATPPLWVGRDARAAREWAMRRLDSGKSVVVKPLFGSQGQGLRLLREAPEVDEVLRLYEADDEVWFGGVYYLQEFVAAAGDDGRGGDWRVFVIGGKAVAAMERCGETWIHNIATGAEGRAVALDDETARLAVAAARVCGLGYAGVDLIHDAEKGAQVIEVNSIPAWKGLQATTEVDITAELVQFVVSQCYARKADVA